MSSLRSNRPPGPLSEFGVHRPQPVTRERRSRSIRHLILLRALLATLLVCCGSHTLGAQPEDPAAPEARQSITAASLRAAILAYVPGRAIEFGKIDVVGDLNLAGVTLDQPVVFSDCSFLGDVIFADSTFGGDVSFFECRFDGLDLSDTTVAGDLRVLSCDSTGSVRFADAQCEGSVFFDGMRCSQWLVLDSTSIEGRLSLTPDFRDEAGSIQTNTQGEPRPALGPRIGHLSLSNLEVTDDVRINSSSINPNNVDGWGIDGTSVRAGSLVLQDCKVGGPLRLPQLDIRNDLHLMNVEVHVAADPETSTCQLDLTSLRVGGVTFLTNCTIGGWTSMLNTTFGRTLSVTGGSFSGGIALGFSDLARTTFSNVTIDGNLSLIDARYAGLMVFQDCTIVGSLSLTNVRGNGKIGIFGGAIGPSKDRAIPLIPTELLETTPGPPPFSVDCTNAQIGALGVQGATIDGAVQLEAATSAMFVVLASTIGGALNFSLATVGTVSLGMPPSQEEMNSFMEPLGTEPRTNGRVAFGSLIGAASTCDMIMIAAADIDGNLNLFNVKVLRDLFLVDVTCRDLTLDGATLGEDLRGAGVTCRRRFTAEQCDVTESVYLWKIAARAAENASEANNAPAVSLYRTSIGRDVSIDALQANGDCDLSQARVAGSLWISDSEVLAGGDLDLGEITVLGNAVIRCAVSGEMNLQTALLGGACSIGAAGTEDLRPADWKRIKGGLRAEGLTTTGPFVLRNCRILGYGLGMSDAAIGADLLIANAEVTVMNFYNARVLGSVGIGGSVATGAEPGADTSERADGDASEAVNPSEAEDANVRATAVALRRMAIRGDVVLERVKIQHGMSLNESVIEGSVRLADITSDKDLAVSLDDAVVDRGIRVWEVRASRLTAQRTRIGESLVVSGQSDHWDDQNRHACRFGTFAVRDSLIGGDFTMLQADIKETLDLSNSTIDGAAVFGLPEVAGRPCEIGVLKAGNCRIVRTLVFGDVKIGDASSSSTGPAIVLNASRVGKMLSHPGFHARDEIAMESAMVDSVQLQACKIDGPLKASFFECGTFLISPTEGVGSRLGALILPNSTIGEIAVIAVIAAGGEVNLENTVVAGEASLGLARPEPPASEGVEPPASTGVNITCAEADIGGSLRIKGLADTGRDPVSPLVMRDALADAIDVPVRSLMLQRMTVGGSVELQGIRVAETASLEQVSIAQNLLCTRVRTDESFEFAMAEVRGGVFLTGVPSAAGGIVANDSRIGVLRLDVNNGQEDSADQRGVNLSRASIDRLELRGDLEQISDGDFLDLRQATIRQTSIDFKNAGPVPIVDLLGRMSTTVASRDVYARFVKEAQEAGLQKEANSIWLAGQWRHSSALKWWTFGWWTGFGLWWWWPLLIVAILGLVLCGLFWFQPRSVDKPDPSYARHLETRKRARAWRRKHGWSCFDGFFLAIRYVVPPVSLVGVEWRASSERILSPRWSTRSAPQPSSATVAPQRAEANAIPKTSESPSPSTPRRRPRRRLCLRCDTVAKICSLVSWLLWPIIIAGILNVVKIPQPL